MEEIDANVKAVAEGSVPEWQIRGALIESNTLQKILNFATRKQYVGGKIRDNDNNTTNET